MMKALLPAPALLFLFACASVSTDVTPMTSPKYKGKAFGRILAISGGDLKAQGQREALLCEGLIKHKVQCWRGLEVFPPTEHNTADIYRAAVKSRSIEGILEIEVTGSNVSHSYLPPSFVTNCSTGGICSQSLASPGGNVDKPSSNFRVKLLDASSGDTAWMADIRAGGNAFSDFDDVNSESMSSILNALAKDGFIPAAIED